MTNQDAIDLLDAFIETSSDAIRRGVWALAFLHEGGEPTWDAVKSVSNVALELANYAERVGKLRDQFEDIAPF